MADTKSTSRFYDVKGYPGYVINEDGVIWSFQRKAPRKLKPDLVRNGHHMVRLVQNGKSKGRYVHSLVLETFVGPRPSGMQCCHDDGNALNNRLSNLRWDTPKANCADRDRHGTTARGSKNGFAKLTEKQILLIYKLRHRGWTQQKIGDRVGVCQAHVSRILLGIRWNHVQE